MTPRPPSPPVVAYVDDECSVCRVAGRMARWRRQEQVWICDLSEARHDLDRGAVGAALHVVDADGRMFVGYDAISALTLARGHPWLWRLMQRAPVGAVGRRVYGCVARIRPSSRRPSRP